MTCSRLWSLERSTFQSGLQKMTWSSQKMNIIGHHIWHRHAMTLHACWYQKRIYGVSFRVVPSCATDGLSLLKGSVTKKALAINMLFDLNLGEKKHTNFRKEKEDTFEFFGFIIWDINRDLSISLGQRRCKLRLQSCNPVSTGATWRCRGFLFPGGIDVLWRLRIQETEQHRLTNG